MQSPRSVENVYVKNPRKPESKTNLRSESAGSRSDLETKKKKRDETKQRKKSSESESETKLDLGFASIEEVQAQQADEIDDTQTNDSDDDESTFKITNLNDEPQDWWKDPVNVYAFNLPTVQANLERLVETNKIKYNDHQFMMNLRTIVWNDFNEKLSGRIKQREGKEIERTKQLILTGKYNSYNCPKKFVPLHSDILALELRSEEMSDERTDSTRDEGRVFSINKKTNTAVHLRRQKLKSMRKTHFENLIRQVVKDSPSENVEYNETKAIQSQIIAILKRGGIRRRC